MQDSKLYKCDCGEFSFLEVLHDTNDDSYYVTITAYPRTFKEKARAIWAVLRGATYGASEEMVLNKENAEDLSNFIEHFKKHGRTARKNS